jgi:hypothetical protein
MAMALAEQLAHCTVRIEVDTVSGVHGYGTGFHFRFARIGQTFVPAVVTNRHVVDGAVRGRFKVTLASPEGEPDYRQHETFEIPDFERRWVRHPDPAIDLCALAVAPLFAAVEQVGRRLFHTSLDMTIIPSNADVDDLTSIEDVVMVGYPNGIWDERHNMPVIRRGSTATNPRLDWNGKPEFLIDAACFGGSSGSPVFLFNQGGYVTRSGGTVLGTSRVKLLGVLYAGPQQTLEGEMRVVDIPTIETSVPVTHIPMNLGMVVKAHKLVELDAIFTDWAQRAAINA